jgi:hypothetical protein
MRVGSFMPPHRLQSRCATAGLLNLIDEHDHALLIGERFRSAKDFSIRRRRAREMHALAVNRRRIDAVLARKLFERRRRCPRVSLR